MENLANAIYLSIEYHSYLVRGNFEPWLPGPVEWYLVARAGRLHPAFDKAA